MKDHSYLFFKKITKLTRENSSKEIDQIVAVWEKAATNGDVEKQFLFGYYCELKENYDQAIYWYNKAIENNYPDAINAMGYLYRRGYGVENDFDKAFELFSQAADEYELDSAYYNLATMYMDGEGRDPDIDKGMMLLERSIELGDSKAAQFLGMIYLWGLYNIKVSYRKAAKYFEKGYKLGDFESIMFLLDIYAGLYSINMMGWKKHKKWMKIYDSFDRSGIPRIVHLMPDIPMEIYNKLKKTRK